MTTVMHSPPPHVLNRLRRRFPNGFYGAIGSCPPRVAAALNGNWDGVLMAAESVPGKNVVVDYKKLNTATLRALANDDGAPDEIRVDADAELERRGESGVVEAPRKKRAGSPTATVDPPNFRADEEKQLALALSHAGEFNFVEFCEREAKRA